MRGVFGPLAATVLALVAMTGPAAAGGCVAGSCNDVVNDLFVHGSGVYLRTAGDETQLNCTLAEGFFMLLKKTHTNYEAVYAALLTAHTNRAPIFIRVVEGSADCEVSYVRSQF